MADDEGADNSVDMNWFFVRANAFNCLNGADPGTQCNPVDQYAYNWTAADWVEMGDGSPVIHDAGGASIIIAYNTESYNFNYAKLNLHAYARDTDDGWSDDEYANGYLNLVGNSIWGEKTITLSCATSSSARS